eukprot:155587-Rhodomonas_salina.1
MTGIKAVPAWAWVGLVMREETGTLGAVDAAVAAASGNARGSELGRILQERSVERRCRFKLALAGLLCAGAGVISLFPASCVGAAAPRL